MNPEELFLQNIGTIERVATYICRRNGMSGDDGAEFSQEVKFRLIENDYAILRKFNGDSRLSTYLHTVIERLLQQSRVREWGKWRPSAEAKRLGDKAITLERLITRDGLSFDEAAQILTTPAQSPFRRCELESIYANLPLRNPRPVLVPDDNAPEVAAPQSDPEELVQAGERERIARRAMDTINRLSTSLPAEEQLILRMRFCENQKVSDIARRLHLDQKKLYKRLDKLFNQVRAALQSADIGAADIDALLTGGDQDLHFDLLGTSGNRASRPSNEKEGEAAGGGKRRS
jgi:RNA polymerase sigma factor (sigma-70 family)